MQGEKGESGVPGEKGGKGERGDPVCISPRRNIFSMRSLYRVINQGLLPQGQPGAEGSGGMKGQKVSHINVKCHISWLWGRGEHDSNHFLEADSWCLCESVSLCVYILFLRLYNFTC